MKYYIFIQDERINGCGQCRQLGNNILNFEVTVELFNAYIENPDMYIWNGVDVVVDPDYEAKQAQKERERLDMLFLTAADVERAIYKAKGMDFEDIIALVTEAQPLGLDIKALKIELKANNFYRGNPYINAIGEILGFTSTMLDEFFETNDYTKLIVVEPEPVEEE